MGEPTEDVAFDDLPPIKRNDPTPFLVDNFGHQVEPGETITIVTEAEAEPALDAPDKSDPAEAYRERVAEAETAEKKHPTILAGEDAVAFLAAIGFKACEREDCPGCHPENFPAEGAPGGVPDFSVPSARVRTFEAPHSWMERPDRSSPRFASLGFVLVVDQAREAHDEDVRENWQEIAKAMGALTLIFSPESIDIDVLLNTPKGDN
jgi:hypothetical protein